MKYKLQILSFGILAACFLLFAQFLPQAKAALLAQATTPSPTTVNDQAPENDDTGADTNRPFVNCGNQDTIDSKDGTLYSKFDYSGGTAVNRPCTLKDIFYLGIRGVDILVSFAGVFAVFMIIIAGFSFVKAAGNPAGVKEAKSKMAAAVIGLTLVLLAFVIINTIFKGSFSLGLKEGSKVLTDPFNYIRGY